MNSNQSKAARPHLEFLSVRALLSSLVLFGGSANAAEVIQQFRQPESRDETGKLLVEESVVSIINCNGSGENGGQFYIYQYVNRPGVRAIRPPDWSQPIGGRDFAAFEEAVAAACAPASAPGGPTPGAPTPAGCWGFSGTWSDNIFGTMQLVQIGENASGTYSGTTSPGAINGKVTGQAFDGTWVSREGTSGTVHLELRGDGSTYEGAASTTGWGNKVSGKCVGPPPAG
ncbi:MULTISPECIES: hypothetical protein [Myxococcus]|nr:MULTISPECIES: hypothetical protein [Myxococcus]NOJ52937.1 hypothetical protein [Myxococcus xanthus]QPM82584.1 hypothetical protein I5Q59_15490 [Myxococcus xanthus]QVW64889.1 hypothetical protein JTM82_20835 [Myxococcus xanthus DZ2]QZZ50838.1 hypothetical protein MyxoNM_16665 [Myxococcus xanthus]UEO02040.1 hypothetical protein K1515_21960 [Myxococcus xanthus DZ2]